MYRKTTTTGRNMAGLVGLDTLLHIVNYLYGELGEPRYAPPLIIKKLVKSGFIGNPRVKVGSKGGFMNIIIYRESET
jgi:3-hydroxybutyryl-CoA dehydrogenase